MKNLAWYQVEKRHPYEKRRHHASTVGEQKDLQARDITYHCDILPPDAFGRLFWATACQRKADFYAELVFVRDGAVWIWKMIEHYFPNAVQIVDWYHASQYFPPLRRPPLAKTRRNISLGWNRPALCFGTALSKP